VTTHHARSNELARIGQHRAPFRQRRLRSQAKISERCRVEDGGRDSERRLHDQRRHAVRQDFLEHQAQRAGAADLGGSDVILGGLGDHGRARDPHIVRQDHHRHRQHRVHHAGAQDGDDHDGEKETRQRQQDIHEPQDRDFHDAAKESGSQPERRSDDDRDRHHHDTDQERQTRAEDQA